MLIDARRASRALDLLGRTSHGRVSVTIGALPHSTVARHIVSDGEVLLRMHRGHGYHRACDGQVVAYGADTAPRPPSAAGTTHRPPSDAGAAPEPPLGADGTPHPPADAGQGTRGAGDDGFWSVNCVGTARVDTPTTPELNRFGPVPGTADGEPFDAVYLRVQPKFVTVHHIAGTAPCQPEHAP